MTMSEVGGLPQTEDAVRLLLAVHAVARSRPQCPAAVRHGLARFQRDYDDAVMLLRQDAPTAYRTAFRAMRARERRQERSA